MPIRIRECGAGVARRRKAGDRPRITRAAPRRMPAGPRGAWFDESAGNGGGEVQVAHLCGVAPRRKAVDASTIGAIRKTGACP